MLQPTRRSFLKQAAAVGAGASLASPLAPSLSAFASVHTGGVRGDELKIGLIGCGGRGTGAAGQALSTSGPVKLVAMADVFADRIEGALASLQENGDFKARIDVPPARRFAGFDAAAQLIASDVDVVLIATPPHFRPAHFEAAVAAGKHIFFEKPIAVDAPGVRRVIAAAETAKDKKLSVVCGLQRHHQKGYLQAMERIHRGDLGRILFARCAWDMGSLWHHDRKPGWSDMEWQLRNWLYFTWLSGDHIVEQHVHNLDVVNWALKAHPQKARGMGGRQVRTDAKFGHIYDHHSVQFEYPGGELLFSECRQIDGCLNDVSEHVYGVDGECHLSLSGWSVTGKHPWEHSDAGDPDPYQVEHDDLFASIRNKTPLNEGRMVAESTMTAILGRMATYSGREVEWDKAIASNETWGPKTYAFGDLPVDAVPMPGRH